MWPFKKKDKQPAPAEKVAPVPPAPRISNDSMVTVRNGLEKKKADMRKLRETLNGCLPPGERTSDDDGGLAKLALALNRSRSGTR